MKYGKCALMGLVLFVLIWPESKSLARSVRRAPGLDLRWDRPCVLPTGITADSTFAIQRCYDVHGFDAFGGVLIRYVASIDDELGNQDDRVFGVEFLDSWWDIGEGLHEGLSWRYQIREPGSYRCFAIIESYWGFLDPNEANNNQDMGRIEVASSGATVLQPSPASRMVYVSSSQGRDTNSGLSPQNPVRTIAKAKTLLRDGFPDWLLLKRGDIFREGLGQWKTSGRSSDELAVISSYGDSDRYPQLWTGLQPGISVTGGGGFTKDRVEHLAIVGLKFWSHQRDPRSREFIGTGGSEGVRWLRGAKNILIEDCLFQCYRNGLNFFDFDRKGIRDIRIRRSRILDSYAVDTNSQGLYASGVDGLLVEDCLFDHNGWNESLPNAPATILNHNLYIQTDSRNVIVRDNIIARGSSHGIQLRPGGVCDNNVFLGNAISIWLGETKPGRACGNIVLQGRDIGPIYPRGWGIDFSLNNPDLEVHDNIIAHVDTRHRFAIALRANAPFCQNNQVHNWGQDPLNQPAGHFVDSSRCTANFAQTWGLGESLSTYLNQVRLQTNSDLHAERTTKAFRDYIRAGFNVR